ncbi:DASH complex subunit ASK1, partial [Tremellales sp. Uapishka_1]
MSQASNAALFSPPFFLIDGIDPNAPISAQTEQIDQLNTLLLQEIDANFARFHQIITSKILPEIKRFAIAGEPTREAATFWRAFFEAAAAVNETPGEDSSLQSTSPDRQTTYSDQSLTLRRGEGDESGSFIFDPPAGGSSSTPLPNRTGGPMSSWEESMESPFDRLDRKFDEYETSSAETPSLPSGYSLPRGVASPSFDEGHSTGTVEVGQDQNRDQGGGGETPKAKPKQLRQVMENPFSASSASSSHHLPASPRFTTLPSRAASLYQPGTRTDKERNPEAQARMLIDDLMEEMEMSSPRPPTPEALRRYSIAPGPAPPLFHPESQHQQHRVPETIYQEDSFDDDDDDESFDSPLLSHQLLPPQPELQVGEDDSFESVGDEPLVPEAVAETSLANQVFGGGAKPSEKLEKKFSLLQPDEIMTYHGGKLEDAVEGHMTPTHGGKAEENTRMMGYGGGGNA